MYQQDALILGSGNFPIDMLRFECAFPKTERDAGIMEGSAINRRAGIFVVLISRYTDRKTRQWTPGRWHSFNTKILPNPGPLAIATARNLFDLYLNETDQAERQNLKTRISKFFINGIDPNR